jgi:hypothetical protein
MASMRKRYADRIAASPRQDGPPVTTAPTDAAKLPEPAADVKPPPEMPETKESPADVAAKHALRERLREMEAAETLNRQAAQPPQYAAESPQQQQQQPAMPAHVEKWLAAHPQYTNPDDAVAQAEIYTATLKCNRDGKTWDQPDFIPALERHLGLTGNGHAQNRPIESRPPVTAPAPRYEAPPRQRQRQSAPVSAPPSREPASMSTGRPQSFRAPLTAEEIDIARASGITPERYAQEKEKMLRMKAGGQLDDRR